MVEVELMFADEKGKRCKHCKVKNHINNTLCWFCKSKFPDRQPRKKIIQISPNL